MTRQHWVPSNISLSKANKEMQLTYADGQQFAVSFEFLRVHSPSAEVRGHSPEQSVLQYGKKNIDITAVNRVGNYAIQLIFDDQHDSGIYSWEYLRELCEQQEVLWQQYLDALERTGKTRDPNEQIVKLIDPNMQ